MNEFIMFIFSVLSSSSASQRSIISKSESDSFESSEILQVLKDSIIILLEIPSHEFLTQVHTSLLEHGEDFL